MVDIKKLITILILISSTSFLSGCVTTYQRGEGMIIAEKKLSNKDYKPHQATKTGAAIGTSVGTFIGAIPGGLVGFVIGALGTNSIPITIVCTAAGGLAGGLMVAVVGGTLGGAAGYAVDISKSDVGMYEFTVKTNQGGKPLIIKQYSSPIPLHTKVHILEKDNVMTIKKYN